MHCELLSDTKLRRFYTSLHVLNRGPEIFNLSIIVVGQLAAGDDLIHRYSFAVNVLIVLFCSIISK
jgi:hypothetical protein